MQYDVLRDHGARGADGGDGVLALVVKTPGARQQREKASWLCQAHPGKLSYGSAGSSSVTHLAVPVRQGPGRRATHVPYRGSVCG